MSDATFLLLGIRDPRLAAYANGSMPAWLWSIDGTRILWSNPVGARIFGARNPATLAGKTIGPADSHRRQVMQLAPLLSQSGAPRMERLRGFGAALGQLQTCACARLSFSDGTSGILVTAADFGGRPMPTIERLKSLLDSLPLPALAFTPDGLLTGTNDAARPLSSSLSDLSTAHLDNARGAALRDGEARLHADFGHGSLTRVGAGNETLLIALLDEMKLPEQRATPLPVVESPAISETIACAAEAADSVSSAEATPLDESSPAETSAPVESANIPMPADVFESVFDEAAPATLSMPLSVEAPSLPEASEEIAPERPAAKEAQQITGHVSATLAEMDGPHLTTRRHPLRFMWQMDEDSRFSLGSDEFSRLIGSRTAATFGRLWSEIAAVLKIDPEGKVAAAVATRGTWSGIVVDWPADGLGTRLPVELSGLPVFDRARNFIGYRGFGVCRDLERLARLAAQRRDEVLYSTTPAASKEQGASTAKPDSQTPDVLATATQNSEGETRGIVVNEAPVEASMNVLPFRQSNEPKAPVLTAGETSAFDELARRLSAQLENGAGAPIEASLPTPAPANTTTTPAAEKPAPENTPAFLQPEAPPPRVSSAQDTQLLDRLPVGVLVYRLDRLVYANRAFLDRTGFGGLHELTEAGGLDALFVEPSTASGASTSEAGAPVVISTTQSTDSVSHDARLFAIIWDDQPAMALMFSGVVTPTSADQPATPVPALPVENSTQAEELSTILDTTAEGIVIFDGLGRILSCNRSAEALFGRSGDDISALNLINLFAPESQKAVLDHLENAKSATIASLLDHGRDMLGKARDGSTIPLSMTMGRTRTDSPRFFAVFRDLSQVKKTESELMQARRQSERATTAKSDVLGRISHEVRMPLNAIIGFADVMIEERFGPLGNERYVEYMKDIRASGQRVMTIVDDLLDLSRIESGKIELSFANQDLNHLIEQCVTIMQPQANRERIIIRTSLAHALPSVKADARALRQIALNLIGSSIHLANAGGQVIVSTATTDFGDVALRVRDTGPGLNDNEIAAAMAPFRTAAAMDQVSSDTSAMSLSLTKALVEANKAKFNIKIAPHSGTLIEVVFAHASAIA